MVLVVTVDQRGSRRSPDLVPGLLTSLADVPTVRAFDQTAGDEVQGVLDDPAALAAVVERLLRQDAWHVGIGVGPGGAPRPGPPRPGGGRLVAPGPRARGRGGGAGGGAAAGAGPGGGRPRLCPRPRRGHRRQDESLAPPCAGRRGRGTGRPRA